MTAAAPVVDPAHGERPRVDQVSRSSFSCRREVMPSLRKMLRRCASIVRGLRKSSAATSREVAPVATSRAICASCAVSASLGWVPRFRGVLAGGAELTCGTLGERLRSHVREQLVGGAELVPGVLTAALPAEPLAVDEVRAGEVGGDPAGHPAARRPRGSGPRRPAPCWSSARERAASPRAQAVPLARARDSSSSSAAAACSGWPQRTAASTSSGRAHVALRQLVGLARLRGGVHRRPVVAETVVEHRRRVLGPGDRRTGAASVRVPGGRGPGSVVLGAAPPPGGEGERREGLRHGSDRPRDRSLLGGQLLGAGEVTLQQMVGGQVDQGDGECGQRTGVARAPDVPAVQPVGQVVVEQGDGDTAAQPQPAACRRSLATCWGGGSSWKARAGRPQARRRRPRTPG